MNLEKELEPIFTSLTIKPTFDQVHIVLALFIFEMHPDGIGRYRLESELDIGSGTSRSLFKRLKDNISFIKVSDELGVTSKEKMRKGHVLTDKGRAFLNKIKKEIPLLKEGKLSILKEIIINPQNVNPYICLVKNAADKITNGIEQRDAAIKINGSGATCLIYNGHEFIFPSDSFSENNLHDIKVSNQIQTYLKKRITKANLKITRNDVIIIGLGDSIKRARLAALNAALTLL